MERVAEVTPFGVLPSGRRALGTIFGQLHFVLADGSFSLAALASFAASFAFAPGVLRPHIFLARGAVPGVRRWRWRLITFVLIDSSCLPCPCPLIAPIKSVTSISLPLFVAMMV